MKGVKKKERNGVCPPEQMRSQIIGANWSARTGVSANGDQKMSANEAGAETTQAKKLAHDPSGP